MPMNCPELPNKVGKVEYKCFKMNKRQIIALECLETTVRRDTKKQCVPMHSLQRLACRAYVMVHRTDCNDNNKKGIAQTDMCKSIPGQLLDDIRFCNDNNCNIRFLADFLMQVNDMEVKGKEIWFFLKNRWVKFHGSLYLQL